MCHHIVRCSVIVVKRISVASLCDSLHLLQNTHTNTHTLHSVSAMHKNNNNKSPRFMRCSFTARVTLYTIYPACMMMMMIMQRATGVCAWKVLLMERYSTERNWPVGCAFFMWKLLLKVQHYKLTRARTQSYKLFDVTLDIWHIQRDGRHIQEGYTFIIICTITRNQFISVHASVEHSTNNVDLLKIEWSRCVHFSILFFYLVFRFCFQVIISLLWLLLLLLLFLPYVQCS